MSAEAVGTYMPAVITLDDLAAMNAADPNGHRYEMSPEGVLSVLPPPDPEHAATASRLFAWLTSGWPADQVLQLAGVRIDGVRIDGVASGGGRTPDITVWRRVPPPPAVWLSTADLLLAIEVVAPGSEGTDAVTKRREYAAAGIPRYWVVDRGGAQVVTLYQLASGSTYQERAKMPLDWLLRTAPADHLG